MHFCQDSVDRGKSAKLLFYRFLTSLSPIHRSCRAEGFVGLGATCAKNLDFGHSRAGALRREAIQNAPPQVQYQHPLQTVQ